MFVKNDSSKLRFDLIPPAATKAMAEVLTHGATKYPADNWKKCDDSTRYTAALMRHLEAYRGGEAVDPDSGFHHMAHVLTNAAFLMHFAGDPKHEKQ